jgi:hypothetical protein
MATIWLHKSNGCDFLVSFENKLDALDFATKVFDKAFALLSEEADYTIDELSEGGILVTNQEIPTAGICIGSISSLQIIILPAGYVPPQEANNAFCYDRIAHVWSDDALTMIFEKEPQNYYPITPGFTIIDREEPYNFTKHVPTVNELDDELADYMIV